MTTKRQRKNRGKKTPRKIQRSCGPAQTSGPDGAGEDDGRRNRKRCSPAQAGHRVVVAGGGHHDHDLPAGRALGLPDARLDLLQLRFLQKGFDRISHNYHQLPEAPPPPNPPPPPEKPPPPPVEKPPPPRGKSIGNPPCPPRPGERGPMEEEAPAIDAST